MQPEEDKSAFVAGVAFGLESTAKGFELEPEKEFTAAQVAVELRRMAENARLVSQEWKP